jgi:hypothetical protein
MGIFSRYKVRRVRGGHAVFDTARRNWVAQPPTKRSKARKVAKGKNKNG